MNAVYSTTPSLKIEISRYPFCSVRVCFPEDVYKRQAFYRMESLELWAKITINAVILGGSYDISRENIDKLIDLRGFYRVTGRHPGYKKYPRREKGAPTDT